MRLLHSYSEHTLLGSPTPRSMKTLAEFAAGEAVQFEQPFILWFPGSGILTRTADIQITNKRLLLRKTSMWQNMFGVLGKLLARNGSANVDAYALTDIASIEQVKFGINKNVFIIHMKNGSTEKVSIPRPEAFITTIQSLGIIFQPLNL